MNRMSSLGLAVLLTALAGSVHAQRGFSLEGAVIDSRNGNSLGVVNERGELATLWRAPAGYAQPIAARASGPVAAWLAARLASLPSGPPGQTALPARLQAFQTAQGLQADGWAGPTTFMQLNRALGVDEPRLAAER